MNSPTSSPTFRQQVETIGLKKSKLELLTNLLGIDALRNHQRMSEANQEAENKAARRAAWGDTSDRDVLQDDDMTQTILGDVTNPTPIVVAGQSGGGGSLLPLLAGALLGGSIPLAGVAGWLYSQANNPPPVVAPNDDESVRLGLERLENIQPQTVGE